MRWLIAGLLFALAVVMAIGTAGLRAENTRTRRALELRYRAVWDRIVELKRLDLQRLEAASPERLAELHWTWLRREAARREERLQ
ncbi:MAG: hypothetical protein KAI24_13245 [Planctomycetes bacterium]|nr:hypothetical protein [Planctomycetota bacterium]